MDSYVHGYTEREAIRLQDQADAVRKIIHHDTSFAPNSYVLEAGCGIGAQTSVLSLENPSSRITSIDISQKSVQVASQRRASSEIDNVDFCVADIFDLPFRDGFFDHVFICYLLEHLNDPIRALKNLGRVLRIGGKVTVVEGDHGSCYWYPETNASLAVWSCLIDVQAELGANSLIGRQLFGLLNEAGYADVMVSPRMIYCDDNDTILKEGFVRNTIIPMVEGVKEQAVTQGMIDDAKWLQGIADLHTVANDPLGTFCYTFFKAAGRAAK